MNRQILWVILILSVVFSSCKLDKNITNPIKPNDKTIPYSPTPSTGAINVQNYQRLSWECSGATSYTIYFDKVTPPVTIIKSNTTDKFTDVIASGTNAVYYWNVVANFSDGTQKSSPIWHFTTSQIYTIPPGYVLTTHTVTTATPNIVKMMFQATDISNKGIDYLTINDFEISEDGETVSIFESNLSITKRLANPYLLKTVLMIDNSTSISDDANSLQLLKDAAINFVNNMTTQQQVALYKFSSSPEIVMDFTTDKNALKNAIDNIGSGFASTNLYGSVIEGVSHWTDIITPDNIIQGSLVLFTDGNDTQGSKTLSDALNAIGKKKVYTVGLGSEIEPEILKEIGNQGAFTITELSELNQVFLQIQQEIETYANSFYWMEYSSPKRGNNEHSIYLRVVGNQIYSVADGTFSSAGFFDPIPGIYINSTFANPLGDSVFTLIAGGYPVELNLSTFGDTKSPIYSWGTNPSLIVTEINPPENSNVQISAPSSALAGTGSLTVDDTQNGFNKTLSFKISR